MEGVLLAGLLTISKAKIAIVNIVKRYCLYMKDLNQGNICLIKDMMKAALLCQNSMQQNRHIM